MFIWLIVLLCKNTKLSSIKVTVGGSNEEFFFKTPKLQREETQIVTQSQWSKTNLSKVAVVVSRETVVLRW